MEKITRKEYNEIHSDFKGQREDGIHSIIKNIEGGAVSVPVEIID